MGRALVEVGWKADAASRAGAWGQVEHGREILSNGRPSGYRAHLGRTRWEGVDGRQEVGREDEASCTCEGESTRAYTFSYLILFSSSRCSSIPSH